MIKISIFGKSVLVIAYPFRPPPWALDGWPWVDGIGWMALDGWHWVDDIWWMALDGWMGLDLMNFICCDNIVINVY